MSPIISANDDSQQQCDDGGSSNPWHICKALYWFNKQSLDIDKSMSIHLAIWHTITFAQQHSKSSLQHSCLIVTLMLLSFRLSRREESFLPIQTLFVWRRNQQQTHSIFPLSSFVGVGYWVVLIVVTRFIASSFFVGKREKEGIPN